MADVHHIISLGIGSPADIPHFILFGLSPRAATTEAAWLAASEFYTVPAEGLYFDVPGESIYFET